jgi:hypothetical protein
MNDIIAFFSRCLLYAVFVVVSKVENTHVEFDMFERVVVTCVQICVLCAAWVVYECCVFIIRSVSRRAAYEHVLADDAKSTGDVQELEGADAALDARVTFDSAGALRKYITQVHMVGIVLWSTMLCSDYALDQTAFMFLLGMLLGNMVTVAMKVHEKRMRLPKVRMYGVYWVLIGGLVSMYLAHDWSQIISYTEDQLGIQATNVTWTDALWVVNVLLSPLSCGCTWTLWVDGNTLLQGCRANYSGRPCQFVIAAAHDRTGETGCPYRACQSSDLHSMLREMRVPDAAIVAAVDKAQNKQYQVACTGVFEALHKEGLGQPLTHPQQYFLKSQQSIAEKIAVKSEENVVDGFTQLSGTVCVRE